MSLFLAAALTMAGAAHTHTVTVSATDRAQIAAAARRLNVPTRALFRAVTAPPSPRRSTREVRYCIARNAIISGDSGQVCHTQQQWERFGIRLSDPRV